METIKLSDIKDDTIRTLIEISTTARLKAYQPYSKFAVGAALQCKSGQVFTGCNVENVSFGLTICAERTAMVKAVSEGQQEIVLIAISAVSKTDFLVPPCGACRQVLSEFNPSLPIYLYDPDTEKVGVTSLSYLLPQAVLPSNLSSALFKT